MSIRARCTYRNVLNIRHMRKMRNMRMRILSGEACDQRAATAPSRASESTEARDRKQRRRGRHVLLTPNSANSSDWRLKHRRRGRHALLRLDSANSMGTVGMLSTFLRMWPHSLRVCPAFPLNWMSLLSGRRGPTRAIGTSVSDVQWCSELSSGWSHTTSTTTLWV